MTIEEILSKTPQKWRYKECDELINNPDVDKETKEQAEQRKTDIKEWLKQKDASEKKGSDAGSKATAKETIHLQDLKLSMESLTAISKEVKDGLDPLLARYYYIQDTLNHMGITHPATIGMMFNQYMENRRAAFLGGHDES